MGTRSREDAKENQDVTDYKPIAKALCCGFFLTGAITCLMLGERDYAIWLTVFSVICCVS